MVADGGGGATRSHDDDRYLWTIKVFVLPPAVIGLFAYCMSLTGGANAAFASTENLAGSE